MKQYLMNAEFVARIPSLITLIATLKFLWYHAYVAIFVKSHVTAHLVKTIISYLCCKYNGHSFSS